MRSVVLLGLLLASLAAAQEWTVQAAAFHDYRQATRLVAELQELGFDAYSEFTMHDGRQYARVRIGCFSNRETASAFARDLRGNVMEEAVAQPLSPEASVRACIEWDTGFVKPAEWRVARAGNDIVFRVELGGQVGFLHFDGLGWQFGHSLAPEPPLQVPATELFEEVPVGATTLVQARFADGAEVNACAGKLLWQQGTIAVVERTNTVIACVVEETSADDAE